MNREDRIEWIGKFRLACAKARSTMAENEYEEVGEIVAPWLYGKRNILLQLDAIEKNPTNGNMVNLNYILSHTPAIAVAGIKYGLKELDFEEIFKDGGINDF